MIQVTLSINNIYYIRHLNLYSEINITIKGTGNQNILNSGFTYNPSEVYMNGIKQTSVSKNYSISIDNSNISMRWNYKVSSCSNMFEGLSNIIKIDLSNFDSSEVKSMYNMFHNCKSLISINFKNFNTSSVTNMGYIFDTCTSLTSIDLSSFKTSKVTDMQAMFDDCWSLISLDLSNFDTSNVKDMNFMFYMNRSLKYLNLNNFNTSLVSNMHNMFYNCYSLKYINLNSFVERSGLSYSDMFFNFSKNTVYCINQNKAKNLYSKIYSHTINNNCSHNCFFDNFGYNIEKNICIKNNNTHKNLNCEKYYNYDMTECIDYIPSGYYLKDNELRIIDKCPINEFFDGSCGFTNETSSVKDKDDIIAIIQNDILSGNIVKLLNISEDGQAKDLTIKNSNILYTITTSKNQNNNANKNESIIKLGECEKKLRTVYNMSDNSSIIIFKIDIYEENFLIPIIEYEVYNPETNQKLELDNCQGEKISISIPVKINEDNLFKYDSSSDYYNDICFVYTSDKGTDISINDRRNDYNNNNQSLCEVNCDYNGYDNSTKKALCDCEVKIKLPLISEIVINKDKLINNLVNVKNVLNLKVLKCYKVLFTKDGLINNIGSYIMLSIIFLYILSIFIFVFKDYYILRKKIDNIIGNQNNNTIIKKPIKNKKRKKKAKKSKNKKSKSTKDNINNINNNISQAENKINNIETENGNNKSSIPKINNNPPSIKNKKKKNRNKSRINILKTSGELSANSKKDGAFMNSEYLLNSLSKSKTNANNLELGPKKKRNSKFIKFGKKVYLKLNDYEINVLVYKDALFLDKRTYCEYYLSLIKTKHLIIFTFYTSNDYNSKIIKICLFFFSFALYYTVNALFFSDSTMHKIYEEEGSYNFIYQLPLILYSTLICSVANTIVSFLSLTEKNLLQLKQDKIDKQRKLNEMLKCLNIKFILFYLISFILLSFFWYYLSCFCAIYRNTQIHLIKDTLVSFGLTILYPFGLFFIPGIFRIPSLKRNNRECIYKLSKILQFI